MSEISTAWETANPERCKELNDQLDACSDLNAKRVLLRSWPKEEQDGIICEYTRRSINRQVPVGSLVRSSVKQGPRVGRFNIYIESPNGLWSSSHGGYALVIGQPIHGGYKRRLMLYNPVLYDGRRIVFVDASSSDIELVE